MGPVRQNPKKQSVSSTMQSRQLSNIQTIDLRRPARWRHRRLLYY